MDVATASRATISTNTTRRALRRALAVCIDCGEDSEGRVYCSDHRKRRNETRSQRNARNAETVAAQVCSAQARLRSERRSRGLCASCGCESKRYQCLGCRLGKAKARNASRQRAQKAVGQ